MVTILRSGRTWFGSHSKGTQHSLGQSVSSESRDLHRIHGVPVVIYIEK
jgi:hypothetical protein